MPLHGLEGSFGSRSALFNFFRWHLGTSQVLQRYQLHVKFDLRRLKFTNTSATAYAIETKSNSSKPARKVAYNHLKPQPQSYLHSR